MGIQIITTTTYCTTTQSKLTSQIRLAVESHRQRIHIKGGQSKSSYQRAYVLNKFTKPGQIQICGPLWFGSLVRYPYHIDGILPSSRCKHLLGVSYQIQDANVTSMIGGVEWEWARWAWIGCDGAQ